MSDENKVQEWKVGQHIVRFEPPDLVHAIYVGDVSAAELEGIIQKSTELSAGRRWFALLDLQGLGAFSSEAKQKIREAPLSGGNAVFGATFQARIVISMLGKVYSMLNRGAVSPVFFADTEQAARAWIVERRKALVEAETKGPAK